MTTIDPASAGRQERMRRTRAELIDRARALTARDGLHGFTVDQVCADVGISRRTFFNYFASKDDAVLGTPAKDPLHEAGERFVERGHAGGDLLADARELIVHVVADGDDTVDPAALMELIRREPTLAERVFTAMQRRQAEFAELIRRYTGTDDDDPFPGAAAAALSHLAGYTMHCLLSGATVPHAAFAQLFDEHLRLTAQLFAEPPTSPAPASSAASPDAHPAHLPPTPHASKDDQP